MKTAVVIDKKKIEKMKKKIKTEAYMQNALKHLAHEISYIFK